MRLIADGLVAEVCSVYLRREEQWLELCATQGLKPEAVHRTRLRVGQGLVGRIAETAEPINTRDAPHTRGFRFLPETGEEIYSSFLGVPIQRLGEVLGVLVVQNREPREYTDDEVYALEVVAMVIAEMAELGAFIGPGAMEIARPHKLPFFVRGVVGQEGVAEGLVVLHEPQIVVAEPISDDPARECARLRAAIEALRAEVDEMLAADYLTAAGEHRDVLNAYRMFAHDKGWVRRHGGLDRERPRRRGRGREGAVRHPRPHVPRRPTPTCASGCTTSTTSRTGCCGCSPASTSQRPRAARRRDPGRAQHRPGRAARLRPQAEGRGARGGLGRQPRRHRRPRARDPARHPGRAHHPRGA